MLEASNLQVLKKGTFMIKKDYDLVTSLLEKLQRTDLSKIKMLIGFDGFVDEVLYVVDKRWNAIEYQRLVYMKDYAKKIMQGAGLSINVEMVVVQQKLGGNGTILANSLAVMGCDITYAGAIGHTMLHPVFQEMAEKCRLISLADPAFTDAIEFVDGKIISSKLDNLNQVTWKRILERLGIEGLRQLIVESDVIGFENWTMLVAMTDIWKHLLVEVLPGIVSNTKEKLLFIDLADPEKRKPEDLLEALMLLGEFSNYFNVILGLNKKEANEIARLYGYSYENRQDNDTMEQAQFLKQKIHIDTLVIHPVKEACAVKNTEAFYVEGPYCKCPKLVTGAGDNFNAGFLLGQVIGCTLEEALILGTANSGFYVRNARSAEIPELCQFISDWKRNGLFSEK